MKSLKTFAPFFEGPLFLFVFFCFFFFWGGGFCFYFSSLPFLSQCPTQPARSPCRADTARCPVAGESGARLSDAVGDVCGVGEALPGVSDGVELSHWLLAAYDGDPRYTAASVDDPLTPSLNVSACLVAAGAGVVGRCRLNTSG